MIYDLLTNIGNYRGMNRNLDKAIDYLMASDINTLPLGKTVIDGDRVFLQVMEARTRQLTDESYEVHRDYMDIQIDIEWGTLRHGTRQVHSVHGWGGPWAGRMSARA